jgi:hypothetical protein
MAPNSLPMVPRHLGRFLWDSFQSYLMLCLGAASLFVVVAAALAQYYVAIAGIFGLWILVLGPVRAPGFHDRLRKTLTASSPFGETRQDGLNVALRLGAVALVIWATADIVLRIQTAGSF